jgi:hypothetical protein
MVHIPIDDSYFGVTEFFLCIHGGNGNIVEDTESHANVTLCMMSWRSYQAICIPLVSMLMNYNHRKELLYDSVMNRLHCSYTSSNCIACDFVTSNANKSLFACFSSSICTHFFDSTKLRDSYTKEVNLFMYSSVWNIINSFFVAFLALIFSL